MKLALDEIIWFMYLLLIEESSYIRIHSSRFIRALLRGKGLHSELKTYFVTLAYSSSVWGFFFWVSLNYFAMLWELLREKVN